jgi:hypothetical protein
MTADTTASASGADDDPAFDIDPNGDAAAYDEWAAIAGEPARRSTAATASFSPTSIWPPPTRSKVTIATRRPLWMGG